jgi:hypothetical protein
MAKGRISAGIPWLGDDRRMGTRGRNLRAIMCDFGRAAISVPPAPRDIRAWRSRDVRCPASPSTTPPLQSLSILGVSNSGSSGSGDGSASSSSVGAISAGGAESTGGVDPSPAGPAGSSGLVTLIAVLVPSFSLAERDIQFGRIE